ncbi:YybS family protein [Alteribacillus persepolensis]|uniref:YybS family protein n=1 Tax=Alteribacillus persepolensis TaxID=568899 RepID=UPI001587E375|nr:DUF2232 domain-containing protein [Alteribacillus persepolensis]
MQKTKVLTEGAVLTGIFIVMMLLSVFVPFFLMALMWFLPLPFIIYTARHDVKPGITMLAAAVLLSSIIGGFIGLPYALLAGVGGVTAGALIRRNKDAFFVLAGSSIAYIVVLVVLYAASILILNIDPIAAIQDVMRQSVKQAEAMLSSIGQEPSQNLEAFNEMIKQIGYLGPLLIVFTGIFYAVITQLITHAVLRRLQINPKPFPPFRQWNFPRSLLWYYLIVSIAFFIEFEEGSAPFIIVWNVFPLLETAMALQGFTVVFYYCYVKSISKAFPIILLISGLFLPFVLLLARILGIIDLGFQLKKRLKPDVK